MYLKLGIILKTTVQTTIQLVMGYFKTFKKNYRI